VDEALCGTGICILVIAECEISPAVRNSLSDTGLAAKGRLPIQTPYSERLPSPTPAAFFVVVSSRSESSSARIAAFEIDVAVGIAGLPFFSRRSAFLDGGSGAETSTSISSGIGSRLRFLLEGGGGEDVVSVGTSCGMSTDSALVEEVDFLLFLVFVGADSTRVSVLDNMVCGC